ncbi:VOC family protein [Thalassotalea mangrovi]|uniref:Dioxygenase n=1 Tax=Thalassotalea mangrovi TaxID=2572245 RepID=A0A4U1B3X2_9GAMM|nr:VOC family protein [Thalassotalea mangrovi]TKB44332.1 dioxygenase [Thalassotalea mangrovi]
MINPFHYAFKVKDLASTRAFYMDILGCKEGRSTDTWVDFDLFGNQLSAHLGSVEPLDFCGQVDGVSVPIPHFGCLLSPVQFSSLATRMEQANVEFIIKPQRRYQGKRGQQQTMFVLDFSGNPLEFKSFDDAAEVF